MGRVVRIIFTVIGCLLLASCYKVERTDGLRAAYEKILLARSLAVEARERKDFTDEKRKLLVASYAIAMTSVNSFLEDVKAKSVKSVDVPLSAFYKDKASYDLDRFISDAIAAMKKPDDGESAIMEANGKEGEQSSDAANKEKMTMMMEKERQESQIKASQNYGAIITMAGERMRVISELNQKKGDPYKRFIHLIDELEMVEFSKVSK